MGWIYSLFKIPLFLHQLVTFRFVINQWSRFNVLILIIFSTPMDHIVDAFLSRASNFKFSFHLTSSHLFS